MTGPSLKKPICLGLLCSLIVSTAALGDAAERPGAPPLHTAYIPYPSLRPSNWITIQKMSGEKTVGVLLYVADQSILLWEDYGDYEPKMIGSVREYPSPEIDRIETGGDFWDGFGPGALVGVIAGAIIGSQFRNNNPPPDWYWIDLGIFYPVGYATLYGILGGLFGGIISASFGQTVVIHADPRAFSKARDRLKQKSRFPETLPPELQRL